MTRVNKGIHLDRVHNADRGMTLIEVLITLVILSIGILGVATLHATSKTSQYEAVQRARAVNIADSIVEKIRNNPVGLPSYVTGLTPIGGGQLSAPDPNCVVATCTPDELADFDMWSWEQLIDGQAVTVDDGGVATATAGLGNPRGCVTFTAFGGKVRTGQLSVLLQWRGLHDSTDAVQAGEPACGGAGAGTDTNRRKITVSTFVVDESEI